MRIVQVTRIGDPEVLRVEAAPVPEPAPGEAVVRMHYAGVNYNDKYERTDFFRHEFDPPRATPFPLGSEGVGVIDSVNSAGDLVRVGQRVGFVVHRAASYADYAKVPVQQLIPLPDHIGDLEAVAVLVTGMTAHCLLTGYRPVSSGMTVLVTGATGAIGSVLTQWASALGARVIAAVSSATKGLIARSNGADEVIDLAHESLVERVRLLTDGKGVALALDAVGGNVFHQAYEALGVRGLVVRYGMAGGKPEPLQLTSIGARSRSVAGLTLFDYTRDRASLLKVADAVFDAIKRNHLKRPEPIVLPLERVIEAHRRLEDLTRSGKIILKIS